PGKESKVRKYWNWYHHNGGRIVILIAIANVFYGIHLGEDDGTSWNAAYAVTSITSTSVAGECKCGPLYNKKPIDCFEARTIEDMSSQYSDGGDPNGWWFGDNGGGDSSSTTIVWIVVGILIAVLVLVVAYYVAKKGKCSGLCFSCKVECGHRHHCQSKC
ncbi:hypothetical protein Godav_027243, partial [Gossypium davidsonii]|nr:hypothetical protein [Gossypium davidsonii]